MGQHIASDSARPDEKVLGRVRALLAKAESTTFPEEAEALTAKAQELMARYSIDAALAAGGRGPTGRPSQVTMVVENPYVSPKVHLLSAVARANRCEAVWSKSEGTVMVFGFPVDLEAVELLFTSLLVQATTAMLAVGSQTDAWGRSRTRSFRTSFLLSFSVRIGERLAEATADAEQEVAAQGGAAATDLLPVLADRAEAVLAERDRAFPQLRTARTTVSNGQGWSAGRRAAERASLTGQGQVKARPRGRLTR